MADHPGALGIIAGEGDLPRLIAEERMSSGRGYVIIRFPGLDADWIAEHPHVEVPHEKPGRLLKVLAAAGCDHAVFAGGMVRPRLNPLRFDWKAVILAPKVLRLLRQGDDAMLRGFAGILEAEGYPLVGAHELLEGLLMPEGVHTTSAPNDTDREDAARAAEVVAALGRADVGQAAVVAGGVCLGVESIAGTDALLDQTAALPGRLRPEGGGGVLYKAPKPGQDWRLDLPAIGPETLRRAAAAGLAGVAVQAGGVLALDRAAIVAEADRLGLFLWGRPSGPSVDPSI